MAGVTEAKDSVDLATEDDTADRQGRRKAVDSDSSKAAASTGLAWNEGESRALRRAQELAQQTTSVDSVREYLKRIGKVALITAEQAVDLATRIEAGLYAAHKLMDAAGGPRDFTQRCVVISRLSRAMADVPRIIS